MKSLPVLALALAVLLGAAATFAQPDDMDEVPLADPVTVYVPRGDHFTVKFWPDRSWYGNTMMGEINPLPRSVSAPADLVGVKMELIRFEFIGPRDKVILPNLDLAQLDAMVGKDLREVERRQIRIKDGGQFRFDSLKAGLYSVRINWEDVPESHEYLVAELRYPEHAADLQALLVPAVTPPPARRIADGARQQ